MSVKLFKILKYGNKTYCPKYEGWVFSVYFKFFVLLFFNTSFTIWFTDNQSRKIFLVFFINNCLFFYEVYYYTNKNISSLDKSIVFNNLFFKRWTNLILNFVVWNEQFSFEQKFLVKLNPFSWKISCLKIYAEKL